jgi:hypothetical protein
MTDLIFTWFSGTPVALFAPGYQGKSIKGILGKSQPSQSGKSSPAVLPLDVTRWVCKKQCLANGKIKPNGCNKSCLIATAPPAFCHEASGQFATVSDYYLMILSWDFFV